MIRSFLYTNSFPCHWTFDLIMQGKLEEKDFNIKDKAGGVNKEFVAEFSAIVNNNTLEIRFYWAGKGTTIIPNKGVYGPLISAIAVTPGKYELFWFLLRSFCMHGYGCDCLFSYSSIMLLFHILGHI